MTGIGLEAKVHAVLIDTEIEGARSKDQQIAAFTGLVSKAAGLVPVPGADELVDLIGQTGKKLVDSAWSEIQKVPGDQISSIFGGNEELVRERSSDRVIDGQTRAVVSSYLGLVEAGVLEVPPDQAHIWEPDGTLISLADIPLDELSYRNDGATNALTNLVSASALELAYKEAFLKLTTEPTS